MKALEFLKQERAHHLAVHNDKSIIEQYDEATVELETYGIKKAMYENILTLIDIECRKVVSREDISYELKMFAKTIGKIISNNYIPTIAKSKGEQK